MSKGKSDNYHIGPIKRRPKVFHQYRETRPCMVEGQDRIKLLEAKVEYDAWLQKQPKPSERFKRLEVQKED